MMAPEPATLPDDVLVEVLRCLSPLVLAASRRVCRAWRDLVDAHLRGHLLSRSVRGIFINFKAYYGWRTEFFTRPSTGPAICGGFYFLPTDRVMVTDHCHGLMLCGDGEREYVVNPATRRWARLPRRPPPRTRSSGQSAYLAFDPAVSPHYEVFVIPRLPVPALGESDDEEDTLLESKWPPASYVLQVFSSMADQWGEKTFLREGEAAGVVADMDSDRWYDEYHAVYWRSVLYIHGQHGHLTRMSFTNQTYRVIRLPGGDELRRPAYYNELRAYPYYRLGRSLRGVYCAKNSFPNRLQLWHLDESRGQTDWVVMHDIDLQIFAPKHQALNDRPEMVEGPWILQNVTYRKGIELEEHSCDGNRDYGEPAPVEEKYDWNSDEDNVLDIEDAAEGGYSGHYQFLGFHPYKEIVYLYLDATDRGLAYDWNKSRFQDLGILVPRPWEYQPPKGTDPSFAYTPCWMGEFPGNEWKTLFEYEKLLRRKLERKAQLEDYSNYTFVDEYELRKLRGHAKRVKDSAKIRRRHRIAAQQEPTFTNMKPKTTKFDLGSMNPGHQQIARHWDRWIQAADQFGVCK